MGILACGRDPKVPRQLLDAGVTASPDVITNAAAVVFWLRDVDTLEADSAVVAVQDLTTMSEDLVDLLSDTDVAVYFTTRSRIYVRAQQGPRRVVTLSGLDFPWGVVFVEPGYAEQIVTGPIAPADFKDMVYDYFGLDDEKPSGPIALSDRVIERFSDGVERVGTRSLTRESQITQMYADDSRPPPISLLGTDRDFVSCDSTPVEFDPTVESSQQQFVCEPPRVMKPYPTPSSQGCRCRRGSG